MADSKITALDNLTSADPANDMIPIVDVSATPPASGNTKRISINNILACSPTATLASATITGAASAAGLSVTGSTIPTNGVYLPSANNLGFAYNSTLGMTLNSTGLGIGGAPAGRLSLQTTSGQTNLTLKSAGSTVGAIIGLQADGTAYFYQGDALPITFSTSGSERMRIDSSGNVGIGVTPNTWASYKALQVQGASIWSTTGNDTAYASNVYYDGAYKFRGASSEKACMYIQFAGSHQWHYTASAGTAGNVAAFTQAMTLENTGSLVLGAAAVATTATDGFLYIPGCAGTPTGTPTAKTGRVPLVVDTTNNKLYFYSGGAWVAAN